MLTSDSPAVDTRAFLETSSISRNTRAATSVASPAGSPEESSHHWSCKTLSPIQSKSLNAENRLYPLYYQLNYLSSVAFFCFLVCFSCLHVCNSSCWTGHCVRMNVFTCCVYYFKETGLKHTTQGTRSRYLSCGLSQRCPPLHCRRTHLWCLLSLQGSDLSWVLVELSLDKDIKHSLECI